MLTFAPAFIYPEIEVLGCCVWTLVSVRNRSLSICFRHNNYFVFYLYFLFDQDEEQRRNHMLKQVEEGELLLEK